MATSANAANIVSRGVTARTICRWIHIVFAIPILAPSSGVGLSFCNGQEPRPCQVVKERGYLVDNLCRSIISRRWNEIKGKVDGRSRRFPKWEK
jgi:hypothetical protein